MKSVSTRYTAPVCAATNAVSPSASMTRDTADRSTRAEINDSPVRPSQIRTLPSSEDVTRVRPSALNAALTTYWL